MVEAFIQSHFRASLTVCSLMANGFDLINKKEFHHTNQPGASPPTTQNLDRLANTISQNKRLGPSSTDDVDTWTSPNASDLAALMMWTHEHHLSFLHMACVYQWPTWASPQETEHRGSLYQRRPRASHRHRKHNTEALCVAALYYCGGVTPSPLGSAGWDGVQVCRIYMWVCVWGCVCVLYRKLVWADVLPVVSGKGKKKKYVRYSS